MLADAGFRSECDEVSNFLNNRLLITKQRYYVWRYMNIVCQMQKIEYPCYSAPEVEVIDVAVERGFINSMEDPEENPEIDW